MLGHVQVRPSQFPSDRKKTTHCALMMEEGKTSVKLEILGETEERGDKVHM